MQEQCFPEVLAYLKDPTGKKVPNLVNTLNLFIDQEGIIRTRGRISKSAKFEYEIKNPILLGKNHPMTELIITDAHRRCKHLGIQTTLNKVRLSGYWIPQARQSIKKVLSQCVICQKMNNLAFKYPKVTNLPKHRVNLVKPFLHTGVDYTGHVWVKNEDGNNCKYYMLIFTCLNVRAIHIELISDMSTHSFILALLRFTNLYGIPSHIYSDNARSFIAGCNLVEEVFASSEFSERFQVYNIKHIKIPLYSAWVGSTWERLIRVVKSCLYKTIGRSRIKYFDLLTLISDIQNAINSRPLTYRCSDSDLEVITPNCFLHPNTNEGLMIRLDEQNLSTSEPPSRSTLIKSIKWRDELLAKFRELWFESYLLSLREQCRDLHEVRFSNKIKVDDVVIVKHPQKPRPYWLLGRVVELIKGDDGKVRSVKVKRGDGSVQVHSIKLLYPLELTLTHSHCPHSPVDDVVDDDNQESVDASVEVKETDSVDPVKDVSSNNDPNDRPIVTVDSNQSDVAQVSVRPKRLAALRGRQRSADDPYIYY